MWVEQEPREGGGVQGSSQQQVENRTGGSDGDITSDKRLTQVAIEYYTKVSYIQKCNEAKVHPHEQTEHSCEV